MAWLLNKPALNIWIGHERHVMTYTIASGKSFNMVLSHIDRSDPATWVQETAVEDMKTYFRGWDSRYVAITLNHPPLIPHISTNTRQKIMQNYQHD